MLLITAIKARVWKIHSTCEIVIKVLIVSHWIILTWCIHYFSGSRIIFAKNINKDNDNNLLKKKKKYCRKLNEIYIYIFHFLCGDMVVVVVLVLVGPWCFRISCCCLRRIAASRASKVMLLASARAFNDVSIPWMGAKDGSDNGNDDEDGIDCRLSVCCCDLLNSADWSGIGWRESKVISLTEEATSSPGKGS